MEGGTLDLNMSREHRDGWRRERNEFRCVMSITAHHEDRAALAQWESCERTDKAWTEG